MLRKTGSAARRRKEELATHDIGELIKRYDKYVELMAYYKLKLPKRLCDKIEAVEGDNAEVLERIKEQQKLAQEKANREAKQNLKKWREGENISLRRSNIIYMRLMLDSTIIQTSHGAEFPAEHGKLAFAYIKRAKEASTTWQRNGQQIRLGHFQIDTIKENGDVKAGCHFVKYDEIETIAKQLELI